MAIAASHSDGPKLTALLAFEADARAEIESRYIDMRPHRVGHHRAFDNSVVEPKALLVA